MTMTVNVAIAQFAPEVLDLKRSVKKACDIIARAKKDDVQLLAFPETWIPTYPIWADMGTFSQWGNEPSKRLYRRLYENSLKIGSAEFRSISDACRKARIHVVIGVNEQAGRSIFNSLLFFGGDGKLVNHHRKLVPTFGERLVWAHGDAEGLRTIETPFGTVGIGCQTRGKFCTTAEKLFTSLRGRTERKCTRSRVGTTRLKEDASSSLPACIWSAICSPVITNFERS
jgi:predicted amidohydrolase